MTTSARILGLIAAIGCAAMLGLAMIAVPKSTRGAAQTPKRAVARAAATQDPGIPEIRSTTVTKSPALERPDPVAHASAPEPAEAFDVPPMPAAVVLKAEAPNVPALETDPEAAAEAFVARTRQEAMQAVDALTKESAALRKRLAQVESALGRFRATLSALETAKPAQDSKPAADSKVLNDPKPNATIEPLKDLAPRAHDAELPLLDRDPPALPTPETRPGSALPPG
jgi:hypothetical protein